MPTEPASQHLNAEELGWLNACKDEAIVVTLFERLDAARRELAGWLLYQHPGGQWVTLRKATDDDIERLSSAVIGAIHE